MSVKIYNSDQAICTFAGIPILTGKADGTWLTVAPVSDTFDDASGADGEVVRSNNNDKRHTVTITLLQSSVANSLLASLHVIDKSSTGGGGVGPFSLTDLNGTEVFVAGKAWIKRGPDLEHAKAVSNRVWILTAVEDAKFEGGIV